MMGLLVVFVLVAMSCSGDGEKEGDDVVVATVGEQKILYRDVRRRIQTERCYGNNSYQEVHAVIQSISDAIEMEVAKKYGIFPSDTLIQSLVDEINMRSMAPGILACVKSIYDRDVGEYARLYLLPKVVNNRLRDFFAYNRKFHLREYATIKNAFDLIRSGGNVKDVADKMGLFYSTVWLVRESGKVPHYIVKDRIKRVPVEMAGLNTDTLDKMRVGDVYPVIREDRNTYHIYRLCKRAAWGDSVEILTIQKSSFEEWFHNEALSIRVRIMEHDMRRLILTQYGNVWWSKLIEQ